MSRNSRFYNTKIDGTISTTATDEEGHPFVSRQEADRQASSTQDTSARKSSLVGNEELRYVNGGSAQPQRRTVPSSYHGVNQGRVGRNF